MRVRQGSRSTGDGAAMTAGPVAPGHLTSKPDTSRAAMDMGRRPPRAWGCVMEGRAGKTNLFDVVGWDEADRAVFSGAAVSRLGPSLPPSAGRREG
jgi:hypothetical protein